MTGLVRKATLFGVCAILAASAAMANVPDATNSTCAPESIFVVGTLSGNPDVAKGSFTLTIRDFANNPISGSDVRVNFKHACDVRLCTALVNGQTTQCDSSIIRGITDAAGHVTFTIVGAAKGALYNAATSGFRNSVIIMADNVKLCDTRAIVLDLDGAGGAGVSASDLGALATDTFHFTTLHDYPAVSRDDWTGDNALSAADIGNLATQSFRYLVSPGAGAGCAPANLCFAASCAP